MASTSSASDARSGSDTGGQNGAGPVLRVRVKHRPRGSSFELDVSLEARAGVTVLFGPSGAGKSTLLSAVAGLSRPQAGHISLDDHIWFDAERAIDVPPEQRGIAFVFQSLALFPHMTARENVAYALPRTLSRADRSERADQLLARMRVSHAAEQRPRTLSGGEAQRVALARALAREPR